MSTTVDGFVAEHRVGQISAWVWISPSVSPWRTQQSQKSQASDHLARTEDPKYTEAVQDADLPSGLQRSGGVPRKDIDLVSNEVMKSTQN